MRIFLLIPRILMILQVGLIRAQTAIRSLFVSSEGFAPGYIHNVSGPFQQTLNGFTFDKLFVLLKICSISSTIHYHSKLLIQSHNGIVRRNFFYGDEKTIVFYKSDIEKGFDNKGKYVHVPKSGIIINYLFMGVKNPVVKAYSTVSHSGVEFVGNQIHATGAAMVGSANFNSSQLICANLMSVKSNCGAFGENSNFESTFDLSKLTKCNLNVSIVKVPKNDQNAGSMAPVGLKVGLISV